MTGLIFLVLGGIAALGFLSVVWRRRKMPVLLRAILVIAALVIVIYVGWTIATVLHPPAVGR